MIAKHQIFSMADTDGKATGLFKFERKKYQFESEMFADVAAFLTTLGPERVISVNTLKVPDMYTHVIVWYWEAS